MADVILYNPKKFNGKPGVPVPNIFNPDKTQKEIILPIGKFEPLGINEMKRYPEEAAKLIVERWSFVQVVKPEELDVVRKVMKEKEHKCDVAGCDYETHTSAGLLNHKRSKHKISKEVEKEIESIPTAKSVVQKSLTSMNKGSVEYSPEGIPNKEVDGWIGDGLQNIGHTKVVRPGMPGVFGG